MKRILTDLVEQVSDADRRHSNALTIMQQRLVLLGEAAHGLRERIPTEMSSIVDRIEGGMAELSQRLAHADAQRRGPSIPVQSADHQAALPGTATAAEAAPALRSALAADALDAYARRAQSARVNAMTAVDNFDVVETTDATHEAAAWERDAADALARLYESSSIDPSGAPALDAVTSASERSSADGQEAGMKPSVGIGGDRQWLEQRLSDVAVRLERSFKGMNPGESIEAIEARFATLEERLTAAVGNSARTDLASLKGIESQVEDLNAQLVGIQTHFSRLDTIELELQSLAERLSTEELAKLVDHKMSSRMDDHDALAGAVASRVAQQMPQVEETLKAIADRLSADKIANLVAGAQPQGPDTSALAALVADQVSLRLPQAQVQYADPSVRIDELKATLEAFAAEQRHGDEQTNTMLDTMQQAMIRLLDRMDAIEQSRYDEQEGEHDHLGHDPYGPPQNESSAYLPPEEPPVERGHGATLPHLPGLDASEREQPGALHVDQPQKPSSPHRSALSSVKPHGDDQPEPPATTREDYVAAARRAARMASEAPVDTPDPQEGALSRVGVKRWMPAVENWQLNKVSMAVICLLLVGASFVAVKSTILAPSGAPAQSAAPLEAPASDATAGARNAEKRLQNLEDADVLIEDERSRRATEPPADNGPSPRRSSLPDEGREANALTVPAALTNDVPTGVAAPKSNELPPISIGPNSLRTAASKGDPSAEFEIGARFADGRGVPQDLQQAVTWYQRSAAQGFAPAQYRLGSMFERGLGVKMDLARARVWYQRAAEQGIVKAMHNLAVLSAGRDSAVTDYAAAGKWFRAAADYGLTDSQFNLAIMHDSGLGMDRDTKQAFKWFSLAARAGDEEASRRRESLRSKMLPQEIAAAEAEIANWRPKAADQNLNDTRIAGEAWKARAR